MVTLRKYQSGDYNAIVENLKEAKLFDEIWDSKENLAGMVKVDPNSIIVAESDGKVAGSVFIVRHGPKLIYLFRLVVNNAYRKHGVATMLIDEATKMAKKKSVKEIGMFVDSDNSDLQDFYGKRNYKKSKSKYFYMWKEI